MWLALPASPRAATRTFVGYSDGKRIAKAPDLKTLAIKLRAKRVDPRRAEIRAEHSDPSVTKMSLRTREPK